MQSIKKLVFILTRIKMLPGMLIQENIQFIVPTDKLIKVKQYL